MIPPGWILAALIVVDSALSDPAYSLADSYAGPIGLSWIHRWALTEGLPMRGEPREPEFVANAFRRYFP